MPVKGHLSDSTIMLRLSGKGIGNKRKLSESSWAGQVPGSKQGHGAAGMQTQNGQINSSVTPLALIRHCTRGAIRPVSACLLSRPAIPSKQQLSTPMARHPVRCCLLGHWPSCQVYGCWSCHSWCGWFRAGIGTVFGSLIVGDAWSPSLKQQLF